VLTPYPELKIIKGTCKSTNVKDLSHQAYSETLRELQVDAKVTMVIVGKRHHIR
jgi:hypothetical protein